MFETLHVRGGGKESFLTTTHNLMSQSPVLSLQPSVGLTTLVSEGHMYAHRGALTHRLHAQQYQQGDSGHSSSDPFF